MYVCIGIVVCVASVACVTGLRRDNSIACLPPLSRVTKPNVTLGATRPAVVVVVVVPWQSRIQTCSTWMGVFCGNRK